MPTGDFEPMTSNYYGSCRKCQKIITTHTPAFGIAICDACAEPPASVAKTVDLTWKTEARGMTINEYPVNRLKELLADDGDIIKGPPEKDEFDSVSGSKCNICGEPLVDIRGHYPHSDRRLVCAACIADKLEDAAETMKKVDFYLECLKKHFEK